MIKFYLTFETRA